MPHFGDYLASEYGVCPFCGATGIERERRPGGNDRCGNGHTYPSKDAVKVNGPYHPLPEKTIEEASTGLSKVLRADGNVQAVGVGDNKLVVYLIKKAKADAYPATWCGWPVEVRVSGRMIIGGPSRG